MNKTWRLAATVVVLQYLLLLVAGDHEGDDYHVAVVTDPGNGPFPIDVSTVILSCVVDPMPPDPVTYGWYSADCTGGFLSPCGGSRRESPNATLLYPRTQSPFAQYYCHVYSNDTLVGVGSSFVEAQGVIYADGPLVSTFTPGDTVVLRVNMSDDYLARYISTLAWYHNGTEIPVNCTPGRFTNTQGTELTIVSATSSDAGEYEVRVASLTFGSSLCDAIYLPLLENHVAFSPVKMILSETGGTDSMVSKSSTANQKFYFVDPYSDVIEISEQYRYSTTIPNICSNFNVEWYHNGTRVDGGRYNVSLNCDSVSLTIYNITEQDIGTYEGVISVDIFYCYSYYDYINYSLYIFQLYAAFISTVVLRFEPPAVSVSAGSEALLAEETTLLTCTAQNGAPDSHDLTWTKDGRVVAQVVSGTVVTYDTLYSFPTHFGVYTCRVDSLYSSEENRLLIQEKAYIQLHVVFGDPINCSTWEATSATATIQSVQQKLHRVIQTLCGCDISGDSFQDMELSDCLVTSMDSSVVFSSALVYSSSSGTVTASTLIEMLQFWLLTSDNTSLSVDISGSSSHFSQFCPVKASTLMAGTCQEAPTRTGAFCEQDTEDEQDVLSSVDKVACSCDRGGTIAGAFFGGLLIGLIPLGIVASIWIILCVKKWRSGSAEVTGAAGRPVGGTQATDQQLEMKHNEAYEQMQVRYTNVNTAQEPIYEQPL